MILQIEPSERMSELCELLHDSVENGASIGFMPPLEAGEAEAYWRSVTNLLFVAIDDGKVVGSVQLDYAQRRNGLHRAEVAKLMVHTSMRRRGIGRQLMEYAADRALRDGRTLLVLDTRRGDPSQSLYTSLGFEIAGVIPGYARSASGELHDTILMYKNLLG